MANPVTKIENYICEHKEFRRFQESHTIPGFLTTIILAISVAIAIFTQIFSGGSFIGLPGALTDAGVAGAVLSAVVLAGIVIHYADKRAEKEKNAALDKFLEALADPETAKLYENQALTKRFRRLLDFHLSINTALKEFDAPLFKKNGKTDVYSIDEKQRVYNSLLQADPARFFDSYYFLKEKGTFTHSTHFIERYLLNVLDALVNEKQASNGYKRLKGIIEEDVNYKGVLETLDYNEHHLRPGDATKIEDTITKLLSLGTNRFTYLYFQMKSEGQLKKLSPRVDNLLKKALRRNPLIKWQALKQSLEPMSNQAKQAFYELMATSHPTKFWDFFYETDSITAIQAHYEIKEKQDLNVATLKILEPILLNKLALLSDKELQRLILDNHIYQKILRTFDTVYAQFGNTLNDRNKNFALKLRDLDFTRFCKLTLQNNFSEKGTTKFKSLIVEKLQNEETNWGSILVAADKHLGPSPHHQDHPFLKNLNEIDPERFAKAFIDNCDHLSSNFQNKVLWNYTNTILLSEAWSNSKVQGTIVDSTSYSGLLRAKFDSYDTDLINNPIEAAKTLDALNNLMNVNFLPFLAHFIYWVGLKKVSERTKNDIQNLIQKKLQSLFKNERLELLRKINIKYAQAPTARQTVKQTLPLLEMIISLDPENFKNILLQYFREWDPGFGLKSLSYLLKQDENPRILKGMDAEDWNYLMVNIDNTYFRISSKASDPSKTELLEIMAQADSQKFLMAYLLNPDQFSGMFQSWIINSLKKPIIDIKMLNFSEELIKQYYRVKCDLLEAVTKFLEPKIAEAIKGLDWMKIIKDFGQEQKNDPVPEELIDQMCAQDYNGFRNAYEIHTLRNKTVKSELSQTARDRIEDTLKKQHARDLGKRYRSHYSS